MTTSFRCHCAELKVTHPWPWLTLFDFELKRLRHSRSFWVVVYIVSAYCIAVKPLLILHSRSAVTVPSFRRYCNTRLLCLSRLQGRSHEFTRKRTARRSAERKSLGSRAAEPRWEATWTLRGHKNTKQTNTDQSKKNYLPRRGMHPSHALATPLVIYYVLEDIRVFAGA